ncbi:MAG: hypothetical protein N4R88_01235 [Lactobacillus iners]|uniref:DUF6612 family protein n=1 Tax=Lactobacillus iners TaxID=147802 RepID=UPI00336A37E6|nr:hypothetical protein [Lactobacillus iners]
MNKRHTLLFTLMLVCCMTSGCAKKAIDNQSSNDNIRTVATTTLKHAFNQSFNSGHFIETVQSKKMKQNSSMTALFKPNLVNITYSLNQGNKVNSEQFWLNNNMVYILLPQNKGKWIKNTNTNDKFSPDQIFNRFNAKNFSNLNQVMTNKAKIKISNGNYIFTYSKTDTSAWRSVNNLVIDALNTPGSQNMNLARAVKVSEPTRINFVYIINKHTNKIVRIDLAADFVFSNDYTCSWHAIYDEFGQHDTLAIPQNIVKSAFDIRKQK